MTENVQGCGRCPASGQQLATKSHLPGLASRNRLSLRQDRTAQAIVLTYRWRGCHVHFHVIPRHRDQAPELRGPRVFGLLGGDPARHVPDAVMDQIATDLTSALPALPAQH
jgi:hypothetical protein